MVEVVNNPGCQQLAQRDGSQCWMRAFAGEFLERDVPLAQRRQIVRARLLERREQLVECATLILLEHGRPIERVKGALLAVLEDDTGTLDPVGLVAVQQVPDDVIGTPGPWPRSPGRPRLRQPTQE